MSGQRSQQICEMGVRPSLVTTIGHSHLYQSDPYLEGPNKIQTFYAQGLVLSVGLGMVEN